MHCTPQQFRIKTISIPLVAKKKTSKLPETDQEFKEMFWAKSKDHTDKYPIWLQKEVINWWLTVPDCATKNRYFLLSKKDRQKWSTLGRLAYAKRTIHAKDPRWANEKVEMKYKPPKQNNTGYQPPLPNYDLFKQRSKESTTGSLGEILKKRFER